MSLACIHQCLTEDGHQLIITFIQYVQQLLGTSVFRIDLVRLPIISMHHSGMLLNCSRVETCLQISWFFKCRKLHCCHTYMITISAVLLQVPLQEHHFAGIFYSIIKKLYKQRNLQTRLATFAIMLEKHCI